MTPKIAIFDATVNATCSSVAPNTPAMCTTNATFHARRSNGNRRASQMMPGASIAHEYQ